MREFDGVRQEVQHDLLDGPLVAPDAGLDAGQLGDQLDVPAMRALADHAQRFGDDALHGDDLAREFELAGLDLRHVEDIVDDRQQMQPARMDIVDVAQIFSIAHRPEEFAANNVGKADDRVERRAQLVAHFGEEIALRAVGELGGLAGLGHLLLRRPALGDVGIE
jgi:hypothetical protein